MQLEKIKIWFESARPKTLWASISPVLIGLALAYKNDNFHAIVATATLLSAVFIQIGTNYANDYYDYLKGADSQDRIGPTRATQAGLVKPRSMLIATGISFCIAIAFGFYLVCHGGLPIMIIGIVSIFFGIIYTAGPFPLAYIGLGDLFVFIFFGPVAVSGTYYLQTLSFNNTPVIAGIAPGLISVAILIVNNLRDYDTDKKAGKKTLIVRFGRLFGKIEYTLVLFGGFCVPILLCITTSRYFMILPIAALFFAISPIKIIWTIIDPAILNKTLSDTGKILLLYSVLFSIGWII